MKLFAFLIALLIFTTVSAKVKKQTKAEEQTDYEIKTCLASAYTAQVAYRMDRNEYSSEASLLGLENKCIKIIKVIDVYPKENFIIFGALKNRIWSINENKELTLLEN